MISYIFSIDSVRNRAPGFYEIVKDYSMKTKSLSLMILFFFLWSNIFIYCPAAQAFSVSEEREYGEKLLTVVRLEFKLLDDPDIYQYINKLGREIVSVNGSQYFDYHFYMINDKEFNAFAAPSGMVFVHSGLLLQMDNEGELFSVLAHECGHVQSRHIADRIAKSGKVTAGTLAMILAGIAVGGGGALTQAMVTGGLAAGASMNLKFSRRDEEEADRRGYKSMVDDNRDPAAMVSMLKKMYRINKIRGSSPPPYLLTHPEPQIRMGYVEDLIVQNPGSGYRDIDQFEFKRIKARVFCLSQNPMQLISPYKKELGSSENEAEKIMAHYGLSQAYLANIDFAGARENLQKVMDFYPDKAILKTDMGIIELQQGNTDEAMNYFQDVRRNEPGNWYNNFYLAMALQKKGDTKRALELYSQLSAFIPDYPNLYYQIAEIVSGYGNRGEGHFYLGKYYFCLGDFSNARFHLNRARESLAATSKMQQEIDVLFKKMQDVKE